ncbi:MAG: hypothetical protein BWY94_02523 [Actinobacteria bacterium ADurb.BinA094]|nr:MAG: hypothetical protein BWY94_02523 [Actinobacteria bacterium ADurb.BinA094]
MYSRSLLSWLGLTTSDWKTSGTTPRRTISATTQTTTAAGPHIQRRRRQAFHASAAARAKATTMVTRAIGSRTATSV